MTVAQDLIRKETAKAKARKNKAIEDGAKELLAYQLKKLGVLAPVLEYQFYPERKWRFDAAYPSLKIAIEIEGGTHSRGRHTRHAGFEKDCEKYNTATLNGWKGPLRFTYAMVRDGRAAEMIREAVALALQGAI